MQNCIEVLLFQVSHCNRCYMSLSVVVGRLRWAGWHHSHRGLGGVNWSGQGLAWISAAQPVSSESWRNMCLVFTHFYCLSLEIGLYSHDVLTMSSLFVCSAGLILMEWDIWRQGNLHDLAVGENRRSHTEPPHLHLNLKVNWTAKWMGSVPCRAQPQRPRLSGSLATRQRGEESLPSATAPQMNSPLSMSAGKGKRLMRPKRSLRNPGRREKVRALRQSKATPGEDWGTESQ